MAKNTLRVYHIETPPPTHQFFIKGDQVLGFKLLKPQRTERYNGIDQTTYNTMHNQHTKISKMELRLL
jgi:hypothetical protein